MKTISDEEIAHLRDFRSDVTFENVTARQCQFINCGLSLGYRAVERSRAHNITLQNCSVQDVDIGPALIEDVLVDGLKTDDLFILFGTVFKHVTFRGDLGRFKLNNMISVMPKARASQKAFDADRKKRYQEMDWALDIRNARFAAFYYEGIPARLVRHDPETQVVVTRERALTFDWSSSTKHGDTYFGPVIAGFLGTGEPDIVLVTPLNVAKDRRDKYLKQLALLRQMEVIEPE